MTGVAVGRALTRVTSRQRLGPGPQVEDHASVIAPTDPRLSDPFLVMMEDWFSTPGFDWHPHRGLETVTTVLDGVLEHGDSLGNAGSLQAGDIQWMTAGRGIIHRELAYRDEHAHTLQLWVNLPRSRKMTPTRYQNLLGADRPRVRRPGVEIDVVAGTVEGVTAPTVLEWPIQAAVLTLDPAASIDYRLPLDHRAFVHVLSGRSTVGGRDLAAGDTGWSDPIRVGTTDDRTGAGQGGSAEPGPDGQVGSGLLVTTPDRDGQARLMIFSGPPIGEPVAMGGPFVMTSAAEITEAFADYRAGRFGAVPRRSRL